MHIFLIGYMGAGKSTVASKLARKLGLPFTDLDQYIGEKHGMSVPQLISGAGEQAFRKMEHEGLLEVTGMEDRVVATGGGTPCFLNNMEIMKNAGLTVYLRLHPDALYQRLVSAKKTRPLLRGLQGGELKEHIRKQLGEREKYYLQSHIVHKGESLDIDELSSKITDLTGRKQES